MQIACTDGICSGWGMPKRTVDPQQLQAARALLGWSQTKLAKMAKSSRATVHRFERRMFTSPESIDAMRAALERAGVYFILANAGGGPGVRLKKKRRI